VILPIGHDEMTVRRLPWVTFGIMAICVGVMVGTDPSTTFTRFGLIPDDPSAKGLFAYSFIHAGWIHLVGNLFLLLLAGPPLEDRWGRPLFAAFFLSSSLFAGAFFMTTASGSPLPLVGASGATAGLLGACMIRHWKKKIRFLYFFFFIIPPRFFKGTFHAPVWAMLPLWFGTELLSASLARDVGSTGGVAYWAHVGGFLWGAMIAAAIGRWRVEERFIHSAIEEKITVMSNPIVEEAMEARSRGDFDHAYRLLTQAAKETPDDPETITALWEVACALRLSTEAAPAMLRIASCALRDGEKELATQYWNEVAERAPEARAEPTWLVRLVPVLLELDQPKQAALALRHTVSEGQSISLGTSLRVLDLARGVDANAGIYAARTVLASPTFHESKRDRIRQLLAEFEEEAARQPSNLRQGAGIDRSISLDLSDDIPPPVPSEPGDEQSLDSPFGLELDATGALVTANAPKLKDNTEYFVGLPPEEVIPDSLGRFMSVKTSNAVPVELLDDSIVLAQPDGKSTKLNYQKIDAIAVGAVPGKSSKPVLVVDLVLNWNDTNAETLRTVRLQSDAFDVRRLVPIARRPTDAFRTLVAELLSRSSAVPLPDENGARGHPFHNYPDLEAYQREALAIEA